MATLSGRDRGQLLLAGAFVLAVAMIGLTLVFSAGSYTASLAGEEGAVSQGSSAITARESVRASLADTLELVNTEYPASTGTVPATNVLREQKFRTASYNIRLGTSGHHARRGRLVEVTGPYSFDDGVRIKQTQTAGSNDPSLMEPTTASPDNDWNMVTSASVRNLSFEFSDVPGSSGAFQIIFRTGPGDWVIDVSQPGGSGNPWQVTVQDNTGGSPSFSGTCSRSRTGDMTLDLSAATMDGTHCSALEAIQLDSSSYTVGIEGGNQADGRYWLTANPTPSGGINGAFIGSSWSSTEDVLYAATATFEYHSASVTYETPLTIAPGEIE